jgi:hypothetical protein
VAVTTVAVTPSIKLRAEREVLRTATAERSRTNAIAIEVFRGERNVTLPVLEEDKKKPRIALAAEDMDRAAAVKDKEYTASLATQDKKHAAALAAQDKKHAAALAAQDKKHDAALASQDKKHTAALVALTAALATQDKEHSAALANRTLYGSTAVVATVALALLILMR